MEHRKYDHVERIDHPDVNGIDVGTVHVFPKLDGANASIWWPDAQKFPACGSRSQTLSAETNLQGFHGWTMQRTEELRDFFNAHGSWRLYGEWLVPHTLKTYRESAWRQFYVFDVFDHTKDRYVHFDQYREELESWDVGLLCVEPLCVIKNPTLEQLHNQVQTNTYLIEDNAGLGEGVVVKNYDWDNRHGRQPWAKIVRNEFKEQNKRAFGMTEKEGGFQVEAAIAEEFVTPHLVSKTRAKIESDILDSMVITDKGGIELNKIHHLAAHRRELIPRLLQTVYTDLIVEESYHFVKKHKDPTINFKRLRQHSTARVKSLASDLF